MSNCWINCRDGARYLLINQCNIHCQPLLFIVFAKDFFFHKNKFFIGIFINNLIIRNLLSENRMFSKGFKNWNIID